MTKSGALATKLLVLLCLCPNGKCLSGPPVLASVLLPYFPTGVLENIYEEQLWKLPFQQVERHSCFFSSSQSPSCPAPHTLPFWDLLSPPSFSSSSFLWSLSLPLFIPVVPINSQNHNKKPKRNSEIWTCFGNAFLELNANNFLLLLLLRYPRHHSSLSYASDMHGLPCGASHLVLSSSYETEIIWPILQFPRFYNQEVAGPKVISGPVDF